MGSFYVNFATRGPEQAAVVQSLRSAQRKAYVSQTVDAITLFFDEASDSQDDAVIAVVGKQTSNDLKAPVLAVLNHDSDILAYWLFEAGMLVDEYDSSPGYLAGKDESPSGGNAAQLCDAFGVLEKAEAVEEVLRGEEYDFADDRHDALARLLKLPYPFAFMDYDDMNDDSLKEAGLSKAQVVRIE